MNINLLDSRGILLDMLEKRGYNIDKYKDYSINEIRLMSDNDMLDMILEKPTGMKCYVKYHISKKLKSTDLRKAVLLHYKMDADDDGDLTEHDELIIICNDANIAISKKYGNFMSKLENYYTNNFFVQIFNVDSLLFDITKHNLVPEHIILTEDEKQDLLKHFNISEDKLPRISRYDPVAKYLGMRPKQVCKIVRNSYTSGVATYYRICY